MESTDILAYIILGLIAVYAISYWVLKVFVPFNEERKYIKMEINRSQCDEEYEYWLNELKILYLKNIPLLGRKYRNNG